AWNHGDIQDEIASTWIGYVGPGVLPKHEYDKVWTDHTDARPTILALLGLKDDNVLDGRVVTETVKDDVLPVSLRGHTGTLDDLGAIYKQLFAPFGSF